MSSDTRCDQAMLQISVAHDEGRGLSPSAADHIAECHACSDFAARIDDLDGLLARGDYDRSPDLTPAVMERATRTRTQWWSIAAVALVGIVVGALIGGLGTRPDIGQAQDLGELFHTSATDLEGLSADLLVVERGVHPIISERVYTGSIDYAAPERLSIRLIDTTRYPGPEWPANDVRLTISNGDLVTVAGSPCPVSALPDCLVGPATRAVRDQPPFDDGVLLPLEIAGPARSLARPGGVEVLGTTDLDGTPTIQVRSTVAAVELIGAITDHGAWRELHPTDRVLMWLDEETLVPLRVEVFATGSPERELWQLRHDYDDEPGDDAPIFIIELTNLVPEPGQVEGDAPGDAPSRGFVDGDVDIPQPNLPAGFEPHRSGFWLLPDGGRVEVASWNDGRSWLMVELVTQWEEPRLFGLSLPFVEPIDLDEGSVGYLSPTGDALAVHGETSEVLISGSVPTETLVEAAASVGVRGLAVPSSWQEASTVDIAKLPDGTMVPDVEGWSVLGRVDEERTTILLTGSGARSVIVSQSPGNRLDPPTGPDYSGVEVRGADGRYNASEATLEWVEVGQVIRMRSETVGLAELVEIAGTLETR
ncbi:MAG TPA: hypothetical protein VF148_15090 [Acidimicrobiia bacterium]